MRVFVHRRVADDLAAIALHDRRAAGQLRAALDTLAREAVRGADLGAGGSRVFVVVPGYGIVADGIGTPTLHVLGVGALPRLYDADRLADMARSAEPGQAARQRVDDRTVACAAEQDRGPST